MNTISMQAVAKTVQNDNLRAAELHRIERETQAGQPKLASRFFKGISNLLNKAGERAQKQHTHQSSRRLGWAEK